MRTAVVLLHAFPLDARMWKHQVDLLGNDYELIAPDLRGFGRNAAQASGLDVISIEQAADDVANLLDREGIEKAVVGGISRGGYIAMAFARRHPRKLAGLMLFDTRATPADDNERRFWLGVAERLRAEGIAFLPDALRDRLFGPTALHSRRSLVAEVESWILSQNPNAVAAAAMGMPGRADFRASLSQIQAPALALAGTEDSAFASTKEIAEVIPGAEFVEIPAAGHLTPLEDPGRVSQAIRRFLDRTLF